MLEIAGHAESQRMPFNQSVPGYIEQFHSTASLARLWMPAEESAAFDDAIGQAVRPYSTDGTLEMTVVATITWGRPVLAG